MVRGSFTLREQAPEPGPNQKKKYVVRCEWSLSSGTLPVGLAAVRYED